MSALFADAPLHDVHYRRPEKALTRSDQLKAGMEVWHVYLKFDEKPHRRVIQKIGTLADIGESGSDDGVWFRSSPERIHSCHDCSLDGAAYNNNYLFATEQDALDAIADRKVAAK